MTSQRVTAYHVGLTVSDLERARGCYSGAFGLELQLAFELPGGARGAMLRSDSGAPPRAVPGALGELGDCGAPLRHDQDEAWREFRRIRARYEPLIAVLGRMTDAPRSDWSSWTDETPAPQSAASPPRPGVNNAGPATRVSTAFIAAEARVLGGA